MEVEQTKINTYRYIWKGFKNNGNTNILYYDVLLKSNGSTGNCLALQEDYKDIYSIYLYMFNHFLNL